MSPLNITHPLGIWSIMATIRVMSNIPKMGQLPTPAITGQMLLIELMERIFFWDNWGWEINWITGINGI
jgi:hypothetical protein